LLRASGQHDNRTYTLAGVTGGATGTGVAGGAEMLALADAALGRDDLALTGVRHAVVAALGAEALVDAAAVIGGFDGITRIADATGIPLEPAKAEQTADFFAELALGRFRMEKV